MSDETLYTARDLILAKRQGYAARMWESLCMTEAEVRATIAARYPLPKITRPRVVSVGDGFDYRYHNGVMERRHHTYGSWERTRWSVGDFLLVADLLANPTEEVDDAD